MDLVGFNRWMKKFPNHFFVRGDLEDLDLVSILLAVAADDGVSVRESLPSARITEAVLDIFVVDQPGDAAIRSEFHGLVAMGQVDQGVSRRKKNCCERPVLCFTTTELRQVVAKTFTTSPDCVYSFTLNASKWGTR